MEFLLRLILIMLYVLWLPAMLLGRALSRDPLQLKKPETSSYWLVRQSRSSRESYFSEDSENEGRRTYREESKSGPQAGATRSPMFARILKIASRIFAGPPHSR